MKKLADNITFFLLSQKAISKEDFEVYSYGIEYILSFSINMIGILVIAFVTNSLLSTVGFIMGFFGLRSSSGGYHASTHFKCLIISYCTICFNTLFSLLCSQYQFLNISVLIIIISVLSISLIFVYSPCDHINRPFSKNEYIKFKKQSQIFVIMGSLISIFGSLIFKNMFFLSICIGILVASVSVALVKIKGGFLYENEIKSIQKY